MARFSWLITLFVAALGVSACSPEDNCSDCPSSFDLCTCIGWENCQTAKFKFAKMVKKDVMDDIIVAGPKQE
ncbi:uncharacterized protein RHO25_012357 [Cercospora beticola]|uniref:Extracellular membrane protein CFEM domain-containing protein n=1 Tax=Cercospora beticola TaxID=122368 RepID=A0ABZ0P7K8_CERBT|nr:hypothetical protein RHO25_012357 [Cercospora beticola]